MNIDITQLDFIDDTLKEVVIWTERALGMELTITSLYRPGDSGVHGQLPVRGVDCRCYNPVIGKLTENMVNAMWKYDRERPDMRCCIYHDVGRGAHLHFQTHPNTRMLTN